MQVALNSFSSAASGENITDAAHLQRLQIKWEI